jgi:alpha-tubulin suppressor-like RCC1 family protein
MKNEASAVAGVHPGSAAPASPRRRVLARVLAVGAVALAALAACSAPGKGALIMAISTDMQTPKDVSMVSVFVSEGPVVKFDYIGVVLPDGTLSLPSTLALVEPDDPSTQIRIRVIAFNQPTAAAGAVGARVLRDIQTTIPHERIGLLRVPLDFIDDGSGTGMLPSNYVPSGTDGVAEGVTTFDPDVISSICDPMMVCQTGAGQCMTSIDGQCAAAAVDSSTLPDYSDDLVFGPGGSATNENCFSVGMCFSGATPVNNVTFGPSTANGASTCSFPLPGTGGSTTTFADGGVASAGDASSTALCEGGQACPPPNVCCVTESGTVCATSCSGLSGSSSGSASGSSSGSLATGCTSAAECSGDEVCCATPTEFLQGTGACASSCPAQSIQVCSTASECSTGMGCCGSAGTLMGCSSSCPGADASSSTEGDDGGGVVPVRTIRAPYALSQPATQDAGAKSLGSGGGGNSASGSSAGAATGTGLNFALVTQTTGDCITGNQCFIPIENDPNEGWSLSGNTITLAPGICKKVMGGDQIFMAPATSGSCATKVESQPVCEQTQGTGESDSGVATSDDGSTIASGSGGGSSSGGFGGSDGGVSGGGGGGSSSGVSSSGSGSSSSPLADVQSVAAGQTSTCAVLATGDVDCWGEITVGASTTVATPVQGLSNVSSVTVGGPEGGVGGTGFACALENGEVDCWGVNTDGQLGNDTTTTSNTPVQVQQLTGTALSIAAGGQFACALISGGTVNCWGLNTSGQLGNGTTTEATTATTVMVAADTPLSGVQGIAAGQAVACALISGGTVDCWGSNQDKALGAGVTGATSLYAVPVQGVQSVTGIAAGAGHVCVSLSGTVECWGLNTDGQLGDGSTTTSATPVPAQGITTATWIGAGAENTCAVLQGGTVECWGLNTDGQLGNGEVTTSPLPVQVKNLSDAQTVVVGEQHVCSLLTTQGVDCWGSNNAGQVGIGQAGGSLETPEVVVAE